MKTKTNPERWLKLPDAARRLGVSPKTIHRWAARGQIRLIEMGGPHQPRYFVPMREIERIENAAVER